MHELTALLFELEAAACAGAPDADVFPDLPPGRGGGPARARMAELREQYCGRCPVVAACEQMRAATGATDGLWAGELWRRGEIVTPAGMDGWAA